MATEAIYTKSLGGAEDLLLDASNSSTVIQTRAGKELEITKINSSTIPYSGKFGDPAMVSIKDQLDIKANIVSSAYTVETIDDFGTVPEEFNTVIVKDLNRGGIFISKTEVDISPNTGSLYTVNDGTIFAKSGGGFWVRQYSGAVNVKWFGASSDKTDNETYIIKALESYNDIYIPSGTYLISDTITLYEGKTISGESLSTILKANVSGLIMLDIFDKEGTSSRDIRISNLYIDGSLYPKTCTFVRSIRTSMFKMDNIKTYNLFATLDSTTDAYIVELNKIVMSMCVWGIRAVGGTSFGISNSTLEYAENGWYFKNINYSSIINCTIDHVYKGSYAYNFINSRFDMAGCGAETVWEGQTSNYGSGLFSASGGNTNITMSNCLLWGGNNGIEDYSISIADLGLTTDIFSVSDAANVTIINTTVRAHVNRYMSNDHLDLSSSTGGYILHIGGGLVDPTGEYYAKISAWKAKGTGGLEMQQKGTEVKYSKGVKLYSNSPNGKVSVNWNNVGYININTLSIGSGYYRVDTSSGSVGTFPTGFSGYGIYFVVIAPDNNTAYAYLQDDNGSFSTRKYGVGAWSTWMEYNKYINTSTFNIDSVLPAGEYRVSTTTTGTLPAGNSGYGRYSTTANYSATIAYSSYQDNNGLFAVRNYAGGVWSAWTIK